jgi:hypothetical protein
VKSSSLASAVYLYPLKNWLKSLTSPVGHDRVAIISTQWPCGLSTFLFRLDRLLRFCLFQADSLDWRSQTSSNARLVNYAVLDETVITEK